MSNRTTGRQVTITVSNKTVTPTIKWKSISYNVPHVCQADGKVVSSGKMNAAAAVYLMKTMLREIMQVTKVIPEIDRLEPIVIGKPDSTAFRFVFDTTWSIVTYK